MKLTPQHKQILELHAHGDWICSTAIEYIRDQRKRISELNKSGEYTFESKKCDGRCGKTHHSNLLMRRLISGKSEKTYISDTPFMKQWREEFPVKSEPVSIGSVLNLKFK